MLDDPQTQGNTDVPTGAPPPAAAGPASPPASIPPAPPPPHARLMSMIQGLALGVDAFGKSIATKGREGGVQEVQQFNAQQQEMAAKKQQMALQKQKADTEQQEAQTRILYNRALTNHAVIQNQLLIQTAPLEVQQLELKNQTELLDLYEKAGLSPMAAVAMIQAQPTQEHLDAVKGATNGDLVNHTAIPVHDGTPGAGGMTHIFSFDAMSRLTLTKDQLAPVLGNEQNLIGIAAAKLGQDDPAVKQAQTQLDMVKNAPEMNGEDFFRHNASVIALLNQEVAKHDAKLKAEQTQAEVAKEKQEADPVVQLSKDLGNPEAPARIQAAISDPKTAPGDVPRLQALLNQVPTAQKAREAEKEHDERAKQAIDQGDPAAAGALLASRTLTLPDLKSRQVTPQFITQAVKAAQKIDPNFKAPEAEAQATVARSAANQQFFGNTDSLLVKGGTLDQLEKAATALPVGQIPVFNNVSNLVSAASGQGPVAAYAASVLGVADDYAKVMGGSVGTDTARQQIMQRLDAASSPDQKAAVVDQYRQQIRSQREGRIGSNPYLRDMYPNPESPNAPGGAQPVYLNGKLVGHTTDGKTMIPVSQ